MALHRYKRSETTNTRIFRLINPSTLRVDETLLCDDINLLARKIALEREYPQLLFWDSLNEILYVYGFSGTKKSNFYGKRTPIIQPIARHTKVKSLEDIKRRFGNKV